MNPAKRRMKTHRRMKNRWTARVTVEGKKREIVRRDERSTKNESAGSRLFLEIFTTLSLSMRGWCHDIGSMWLKEYEAGKMWAPLAWVSHYGFASNATIIRATMPLWTEFFLRNNNISFTIPKFDKLHRALMRNKLQVKRRMNSKKKNPEMGIMSTHKIRLESLQRWDSTINDFSINFSLNF